MPSITLNGQNRSAELSSTPSQQLVQLVAFCASSTTPILLMGATSSTTSLPESVTARIPAVRSPCHLSQELYCRAKLPRGRCLDLDELHGVSNVLRNVVLHIRMGRSGLALQTLTSSSDRWVNVLMATEECLLDVMLHVNMARSADSQPTVRQSLEDEAPPGLSGLPMTDTIRTIWSQARRCSA
jgi:hypothetical protein